MNRKSITLFLATICVTFLAACSGGNNNNNNNGVSIAFTQAPPSTLQAGDDASITASVSGDSSNMGVDWTVSCGSADCGSFSPAHTASGSATEYTAPGAVPTGSTVTITATASADTSQSVAATVTISTGSTGSALNGQYAFLLTGADQTGFYVAAGSLIADGNGNITDGEEDFCNVSLCDTVAFSQGGTYSVGADGRGTIQFSSGDLGDQTLAVVVTSSSHALITEFDNVETSSGTLDLQDTNSFDLSQLTARYSFALAGVDLNNGVLADLGGVLTADGSGGFNNGTIDVNDEQTGFATSTGVSLPVDTTVDSFGRVTAANGSTFFAYYIVNAKAVRIIQEDSNFLSGGSAYTQGSGSLSVANLAGNSVVTEAGASVVGSLALAGQFTSDNGGSVTAGFMDVNDGGSLTNGSISGSAFSGFASGRGSLALAGGVSANVVDLQIYLVDPSVNILDPTSSTGGGGALVFDADAAALGIGAIVPQSGSASFQGNYGANLQAFTSTDELDLEGQVSTPSAGNLSGVGDLNDLDVVDQLINLSAVQTLTGTFTADANNPGRFTGSLQIGGVETVSLVYYQASNSQLILLETDAVQVGSGVLVQQQ